MFELDGFEAGRRAAGVLALLAVLSLLPGPSLAQAPSPTPPARSPAMPTLENAPPPAPPAPPGPPAAPASLTRLAK